MISQEIPLRRTLRAVFGLLVWAAHFIVVYASESVLCKLSEPRVHTVLLMAATVLAILAVIRAGRNQPDALGGMPLGTFFGRATIALDALAVLAIVFSATAGMLLPACR